MFEPPLPPLELPELLEPPKYDELVIPENAPALTFAMEPDTELVRPLVSELELRLLRLVKPLPMLPKPEVNPLRLSPDIDVFDIRPCRLLNCPPPKPPKLPKAEVKPPVMLDVKLDVNPDVMPLTAPVRLEVRLEVIPDVNPDVIFPNPRTLN